MTGATQHARLSGRLVMLGFGSVGQAVLPLVFRHLGVRPQQVTVIKRSDAHLSDAQALGVNVRVEPLDARNHVRVLSPLLQDGDFLLNLSVDVASLALLDFCHARGVLYLDTCIEPWPGRYDNPELSPSERSNYRLREEVLAFRREKPQGSTAVVTQGANPGLVSAFAKQALLNLAADLLDDAAVPAGRDRQQWAALAQRLQVKVIHIAERDTQTSHRRRRAGEFVNTWSIDGFIDEGLQPAELGWGTHERHWPPDARRHGYGCDAAILLDRPGLATQVRSWTPIRGAYKGYLVTHAESIAIADHLTVHEGGAPQYRPTVHYAYHPCDDTVLSLHELEGRHWRTPKKRTILRDEIARGVDELGVLLMGHARGAYWYGSRLSIAQARALAPNNSATSLQVVAGILAGMVHALRHPREGVLEPDELDHAAVLEVATPYLGEMLGVYTDWTPLKNRSPLFSEPRDESDPWQFLNFRLR